ncbi:UPF0149 family protein [Chelativorans intermedius]|uniref:UPF0149 family protein n=1 Tax=Chelativorans intermedius TaxID=515947 RepID=A0ABV6D686_9HYPH|nr:UPF0149 family protein [Chelativorans intermedius]MCT8999387.1 UPF0149 family protein [Chelativorans intermedius]
MTLPRRLKQLDRQLARLPADSDAMLLSEFDGFIAGILVCPELIMPSEWLPFVWGGGEGQTAPVFENAGQLESVTRLVMEHYNATANDLHRCRYAPVFEVDTRHDEVLWEFWIDGFALAMQLRPASWAELMEGDEDTQIAIAGLVALAEISRDESGLFGPDIDELVDNAPELIAHWVETLNAWRLGQHRDDRPDDPLSSFTKVGRNDPCPCGSGKKYKQCCGLN